MARTGPRQSFTLRRGVGGGLVLLGAFLLLVGLGSALDYLVAQSHPTEPTTALLLRAEYTVSGALSIAAGFWLARGNADAGSLSN